jgi:two-component system sensor histidine kinase/response regulator
MLQPRILIVDDEPVGRAVVVGLLECEGYELMVASSGAEALALVERAPPDVVLLDVVMAGLDGHEVCRRIRADPRHAALAIVLVTVLDSKEDLVRGLDAGADDFLSKPVNGMELRARVRSMLRLRRQHNDLQEQHAALRRLQQQKQELLAMIVHDLKTPLMAMMLNAESVADNSRLEPEDRASLRDVIDFGKALDRMILDMLDVSRSDEGALVVRRKPMALRQMVDTACHSAALRAQSQRISLRVDVGDLVVEVDPNLLRRTLENLLDNAIKYAPAGTAVQISARGTAAGVELQVADEGPGVPPEHRERIFERFVRLERDAERHRRMSSGLGLAFCRIAVEAHGGRIWVQDNAPLGSCFCIALPRGAPPTSDQRDRR